MGKQRKNQPGYTQAKDVNGRTTWKPDGSQAPNAGNTSGARNEVSGDFSSSHNSDGLEERIAMQWEPNESFPFAQANDIDKVVAVVDAVAGGVDTNTGFLSVLGSEATDRAAQFFSDAAGYIGLLEKEDGVYGLTPLGSEFVGMDEFDRSRVLGAIVNSMEETHIYREQGEKALQEHIAANNNLAETTSGNRAGTVKAWVKAVDSSEELAEKISNNQDKLDDSIEEALERNRVYKEAREKERKSKEKNSTPEVKIQVCPECFTQVPAHLNECDSCGHEF